MRFNLRFLLPLICVLICLASCARQPQITAAEKPRKIMESAEAETYLKFVQSEMGRYEEDPTASLEAIDEIIKSDPQIGYFYYQRATINAGAGNWDSVADDCMKALAKDPANIDAKVLLAKALGVAKKHDEAIRYLEEVRKKAQDREDVYVLLAKEYMNTEKYRQAERIMLDLLARDTEALVAYYYLGAIYGAYLKEPAKAIRIYEKLLEREPENVQVIDAVSQLYLDMGKPRKALDMLLELERRRAGDVALKLKIAQLYYKLKEYPPAIERFEEVLESNPDSDKLMYYLGVLYEESGRPEDAIRMYEMVPPISGLYKDARLRLAYKYKEGESIDQAKRVLKEGIRRQPKTVEFYQYLGGIYEREGDYPAAVKLLIRATKAFPEDEMLFFSLGVLYERMKDIPKAVEVMRKVLKLNPKNAGALNYIGYTLVEQGGNIDEAENMLQEAVHLKPDDGYIVDSLGWLYFKKGDLTRAFFLLSRALKLVPGEPTILKHMGQVCLERGEKVEALKYFKKALEAWGQKENVDKEEIEEVVSLIEGATRR